jgi:anti-anti-sigma factor
MPVHRMTFADAPSGYARPVLSLTTVAAGLVTVLRLTGELEMDTAGLLTDRVDDLVAVHAPLLVVLELDRLELLDAAGITALLKVRDTLTSHGGHLVLRRPAACAQRVLSLARAIDLFDIKSAAATG